MIYLRFAPVEQYRWAVLCGAVEVGTVTIQGGRAEFTGNGPVSLEMLASISAFMQREAHGG